MRILLLLIPMALGVMGVALWAFLWAVRTGQFDDLEGPAHRILMDDDDPRIPHSGRRRDDDSSSNPNE
ncbi:MAG: cbb3-type cytochrome oxidase assembly protein CcoS [Candidatus Competibacteraceae bacterium]